MERMREKRAFGASLPPLSDAASLPQRLRMVEAWEVGEWAQRENEIAGVQARRLELLEQALRVSAALLA